MKAYILDWNGTLTMLGNPCRENDWCDRDAIKTFLGALHARGDVTFGCSGMPPMYSRSWFTFGNDSYLTHHLEHLAHGPCAEKWECLEGRWYSAGRLMDPSLHGLPWEEQRDNWKEWDPSQVTEIVISDDQFIPDAKDLVRYSERVGTHVRFVHPRDLAAELSDEPRE